jgi:pimeloyl-ACP methyl ester carboxylesterase
VPYASSSGVRIFYEIHGSGPALTLIHGAGGNHAAWWQQIAELREHYQVVAIDLRGFGNSDNIPDGPDVLDFPQDILSVLEHAGIETTVLLGQSIGAVAALRAAMAVPERVRAVILAHSLGAMNHPELNEKVKADRALAEKLPVIDRLLTAAFRKSDPAKTLLFTQIGTFNKARMPDLRNVSVGGPTPDEVIAVGLKVCFLTGQLDAVIRPATISAAQAMLPNSLMTVVPEAPHSMYWEAPGLFNQAVHELLRKINAEQTFASS